MELAVGALLDGKVTGITKFGAFVALPEGKTGMVHISEVAHTYVSDINEHLKEGQEVKVKVIGIDANGRVNLSIKKTEQPAVRERPAMRERSAMPNPMERRKPSFKEPKDTVVTFEDRLKSFMQDSESRMADINHNMDKKSGRRRK